jgi:hypothetical protein
MVEKVLKHVCEYGVEGTEKYVCKYGVEKQNL